MKMNEPENHNLNGIAAAIRQNRRFLVATHVRPDGDALGSLLGLTSILRKAGKEADPYCRDSLPPGYEFLDGADSVRHVCHDSSRYDAAILVDCGDFERVGTELADSIRPVPLLMNIDHHIADSPFGDLFWVETRASSTCEMLYRLSSSLGVPLDPAIATHLYTGVLTDTGSFRFANTSRSVLEIAADLVGAGARPAFIAQQVYDSASPRRLQLLARVLSTVSFLAEDRIATAELSQRMFEETATSPMDSEGFINELRSVKTVQMAILFREESNGMVHVSLRSKGNIDVASLAHKHGGGGHRQAAACRIRGSLHAVRSRFAVEAMSYLS
ncbi:MAG: bifunctional oligoribonuclease/PAP phosphatase NrnA [Syntrophobacteraceae bacterium]|nr:bifunctional oligoribonuclease/PAP phosphatase NrnA [Syntrophobacteraceae bacterium]